MDNNEQLFELMFENLKKFLYPQEWLALDLEFSKSELFALLLVDKHNEIIMSQIADYVNVSMSTANGIVERLVKKGYLSRDRSDTDRRIVVVRLTDQGKKLIEDLKNTVLGYIRLINESLDDQERKLIITIFTKVMGIMNQKTSKDQQDEFVPQIKKINID